MAKNQKNKQLSIFDTEEKIPSSNSLKISANNQKSLSKSQLQFNRLTQRIESLEKEIETESRRCEDLFKLHHKKLQPLQLDGARGRMHLAMVLGGTAERYKFGKNQIEMMRTVIRDMCDQAFMHIEPSPEEEKFYDYWSETTYREEMEYQENESKEMFADFMEQMFGVEIDPDILNGNEQDMDKIFEQLKGKMEAGEEPKQRKKSKKELEREQREKATEAIKNKGIRSIYIALAKILHPDTETNLELKAEKEELMKKVTVAFDQKDLTTLLKLEMEWVHKENEHLERLTEEKLQMYISVLKQQAMELEQKRESIYFNPRYMGISDLLRYPEKAAKKQMQESVKDFEILIASLSKIARELKNASHKRQIVEFIDEYYNLICSEDEFEEMFDFGKMW